MKQVVFIVAALLAGFVGGVVGASVMRIQEQSRPERLLRAHGFQLVDEAGRAVSYWGLDKDHNPALAFGVHWPRGPAPGGAPSQAPLALDDPDNQLAAIGVVGDDPFLCFRAPDGKTRVRLYLGMFKKPVLLMEDETGPRMSLGVQGSDTPGPQDNNWGLEFIPDRAGLGMFASKLEGQTYVQGYFYVKQGDPVKYPYEQPK